MAKIVLKKIEASTLIEVLIAMVVIMVVVSVAIGVFSNVLSGGISVRKMQAQAQMEVLIKEFREVGFEGDRILSVDSIDFEVKGIKSDIKEMSLLEIRAGERGRFLGSIKCLIRSSDGKREN